MNTKRELNLHLLHVESWAAIENSLARHGFYLRMRGAPRVTEEEAREQWDKYLASCKTLPTVDLPPNWRTQVVSAAHIQAEAIKRTAREIVKKVTKPRKKQLAKKK